MSNLIFDAPTPVSFASRYVHPPAGRCHLHGDAGKDEAMRAGDVVEVVIEGIGTLRNPVFVTPE